MEADAAAGGRSLSGEKAQRIVEAMRRSVAKRGAAASTFEHVAREAGVSRGLLHYYFATKEQLLVEAVRRDCELRMENLEGQLAGAQTADDFIALMAQNLQETVHVRPRLRDARVRAVHALATQRGDRRRVREADAAYPRPARRDARLGAATRACCGCTPSRRTVAEILFSLGDGFALRMLAEPERDFSATVRAGILCVRALLAD